jgi:Protein ChrB, N-terminal
MEWLLITYRIPAEPSRHRVGVWRELRRAGAISLQQATWALPARPHLEEGIRRAAELVERAEGTSMVFRVEPSDEAQAARLEDLYIEAREAEWREFLSECDKFEREIQKEISKGKFVFAELDEEEQSLDRMRRWFRDIKARDVFHAPSAGLAERRLKECGEILEDFADRVYEAGGTP